MESLTVFMFKAFLNIMSALLLPFHLGLSLLSLSISLSPFSLSLHLTLSILSLSLKFLRSQLRAIDVCNPFHRSSSVSFFVIFPSFHPFSPPSFLSSSLSLSLSLSRYDSPSLFRLHPSSIIFLPLKFSHSLNILISFSFFLLLPHHNATKKNSLP